MSLNLEPGYTGKVEIVNSNQTKIYLKEFTKPEEFHQFIKTYSQSKPGYSWLRAMAYPLRTQPAKEFLKDLFIPNLATTLKTKNIALRIFTSLFAVVLDVLTFPVRLVLTPFRAIYNSKHPEQKHPLVTFLENEGVSVDDDTVKIFCKEESVKIEEEDDHKRAYQDIANGTVTVALKRFVGGQEANDVTFTKSLTYICSLDDDKWVKENEGYRKEGKSFYSHLAETKQ